jgi:hypothetical protein
MSDAAPPATGDARNYRHLIGLQSQKEPRGSRSTGALSGERVTGDCGGYDHYTDNGIKNGADEFSLTN